MSERYPKVATHWSKLEDHLVRIAQAVNGLLNGQSNNAIALTLTPNATSTVISDDRIHPETVPVLAPQTESAKATPWRYVAGNGTITVHHDSDLATDRTFAVLIFG